MENATPTTAVRNTIVTTTINHRRRYNNHQRRLMAINDRLHRCRDRHRINNVAVDTEQAAEHRLVPGDVLYFTCCSRTPTFGCRLVGVHVGLDTTQARDVYS